MIINSPAALWVAVVVACAGCGGSGDAGTPVPVRGTVVLKGKPAAGVRVVLHPADARGQKAHGTSDGAGAFRLTTAVADDGAVPGEYAVTAVWPDARTSTGDGTDDGPDRLGGRCADPKRPVAKVTVKAGEGVLPPIELSGPKAGGKTGSP